MREDQPQETTESPDAPAPQDGTPAEETVGLPPGVDVEVNGDAREARLIIAATVAPSDVTPELVLELADQRGVDVSGDVERRIRDVLDAFRAGPKQTDVVIATASEPVHGEDGRLEWIEGYRPDEPRPLPAVGEEPPGRVNFYNIAQYVRVRAGAHVATLHPSTEGRNGRDVTGRRIDATRGRPCTLIIDPTLTVDDAGRVIAAIPGVLLVIKSTVKIAQVLEIEQSVDFSTGNIMFDGSVVVKEGVRDCFTVKATGDVAVCGLIEAATIMCGGNFTCRRGMAARERGYLIVDGDAEIGFMDDVRGRIRGDLVVRNELMNCEMAVGGRLISERGSIVGGTCVVTGPVNVGTLGSDIGTPTTLILGVGPLLTDKLARLEAHQRRIAAHLRGLEARLKAARDGGERACAAMRDRLEAIERAIAHDRQVIEACNEKRRELRRKLSEARLVDLLVGKVIHPGVRLKTHDFEYVFEDGLKGPVRFFWNAQRRIQYRQGDGPACDLESDRDGRRAA